MGGCTNCKGKSGCDDRKGDMMLALDEAMARVYPTRTWGEPDDAAALALYGGGAALDELPSLLAGLAEELAIELRAATFVREGDEDEPCDYVYVLCLGRTPCIAQVLEHRVPVPEEWRSGEPVVEQYLRLCVSHRAPMASFQQVTMRATFDGAALEVRHLPRGGVYDAPLLPRLQRAVALLPAYGLRHLDFGEIAGPAEGFSGGRWPELYAIAGHGAQAPAIANYLFYPQPIATTATSVLRQAPAPVGGARRAPEPRP